MANRLILIGGSARESDRIKQDDSTELWSCNNLYNLCIALDLKPTRWFEIHAIARSPKGIYSRRSVTTMGDSPVKEYLLHLRSMKIPVYMQKHWPIIPKSLPYPLIDVLAMFRRGYFTNSFSYMLAMAIMEKFDEIEIYGLCTKMETFREYYVHRISTEYLLGYAECKGIKVTVGHRSDLLKTTYLYGYQEEPWDYEKWQEWYGAAAHLLTTDAYNMWRI